ncbi:MAG: hypothetical protein M3512_07920 [Bacteroidota bacterium]|nr:hypothetical protein [Bacteroidota bacterium]
MKFLVPFFIIFFFSLNVSLAQSGGKKKSKEAVQKSWDSPTRDPNEIFKDSGGNNVKAKKKKSNNKATPADAGMAKYEQQKKANAKKYAQMDKDMRKPQYSDPSYFGHKKKPKKRPLKKRKFCHECGITH